MVIGIIKERKNPPDTRVPLTPKQCAEILKKYPQVQIVVEHSDTRCYSDEEYQNQGVTLTSDLSDCDVLLGVKEVPIDKLIDGKSYFFFSHTKKMQPYNQPLMQAFIQKKIRMIDYECLTYDDGQRILGFGFFAGVVGAHNGILTYGKKHQLFELPKADDIHNYAELLSYYHQIKLPNIKIAITGSGKVSSGILEIMYHLGIQSIEPADYIANDYEYPVYTHLKGGNLYQHKVTKRYNREEFHQTPQKYESLFGEYLPHTDLLMNGIYWDKNIPRLFENEDVSNDDFRISVIADITCDPFGSVPINIGASTIADPVYGIDKSTLQRVAPFQNTKQTIDVMAVDNLPNELPRDASKYFGANFEKNILQPLLAGFEHPIIKRATLCVGGQLTERYNYMHDYAYGKE